MSGCTGQTSGSSASSKELVASSTSTEISSETSSLAASTATSSSTPTMKNTSFVTIFAINAGGLDAVVDNQLFEADRYYSGGSLGGTTDAIGNTSFDNLYQTERWGAFSYSFPVDNGIYDVVLYTGEFFWENVGDRIYSVDIESEILLENFDAFAISGHDNANTINLNGISVTDGQLDIYFTASVDSANVAAIEIKGLAGSANIPPAPLTTPFPDTWIPVSNYLNYNNGIAHGRIEVTTYDNDLLGKTGGNGRKASVYLPPNYTPSKKYPVLYALHGIGGDHREWMSSKPQEILDNLYAANKIEPMIVVFPNGRAMNPDNAPSDLFGSVNSQAFYDFWDKDFKSYLIPHIESQYSTLTGKSNRALLGYSMGGMQSMRFGLGNPDYFAFVGMLAPAFTSDASALTANSANNQFKRIFLSTGTKDSLGLHSSSADVHNMFDAKGINHIWVSVIDGGHNGDTWSPGLYNFSKICFK